MEAEAPTPPVPSEQTGEGSSSRPAALIVHASKSSTAGVGTSLSHPSNDIPGSDHPTPPQSSSGPGNNHHPSISIITDPSQEADRRGSQDGSSSKDDKANHNPSKGGEGRDSSTATGGSEMDLDRSFRQARTPKHCNKTAAGGSSGRTGQRQAHPASSRSTATPPLGRPGRSNSGRENVPPHPSQTHNVCTPEGRSMPMNDKGKNNPGRSSPPPELPSDNRPAYGNHDLHGQSSQGGGHGGPSSSRHDTVLSHPGERYIQQQQPHQEQQQQQHPQGGHYRQQRTPTQSQATSQGGYYRGGPPLSLGNARPPYPQQQPTSQSTSSQQHYDGSRGGGGGGPSQYNQRPPHDHHHQQQQSMAGREGFPSPRTPPRVGAGSSGGAFTPTRAAQQRAAEAAVAASSQQQRHDSYGQSGSGGYYPPQHQGANLPPSITVSPGGGYGTSGGSGPDYRRQGGGGHGSSLGYCDRSVPPPPQDKYQGYSPQQQSHIGYDKYQDQVRPKTDGHYGSGDRRDQYYSQQGQYGGPPPPQRQGQYSDGGRGGGYLQDSYQQSYPASDRYQGSQLKQSPRNRVDAMQSNPPPQHHHQRSQEQQHGHTQGAPPSHLHYRPSSSSEQDQQRQGRQPLSQKQHGQHSLTQDKQQPHQEDRVEHRQEGSTTEAGFARAVSSSFDKSIRSDPSSMQGGQGRGGQPQAQPQISRTGSTTVEPSPRLGPAQDSSPVPPPSGGEGRNASFAQDVRRYSSKQQQHQPSTLSEGHQEEGNDAGDDNASMASSKAPSDSSWRQLNQVASVDEDAMKSRITEEKSGRGRAYSIGMGTENTTGAEDNRGREEEELNEGNASTPPQDSIKETALPPRPSSNSSSLTASPSTGGWGSGHHTRDISGSGEGTATGIPEGGIRKVYPPLPTPSKLASLDSLSSVASIQEPIDTAGSREEGGAAGTTDANKGARGRHNPGSPGSSTASLDLLKCSSSSSALLFTSQDIRDSSSGDSKDKAQQAQDKVGGSAGKRGREERGDNDTNVRADQGCDEHEMRRDPSGDGVDNDKYRRSKSHGERRHHSQQHPSQDMHCKSDVDGSHYHRPVKRGRHHRVLSSEAEQRVDQRDSEGSSSDANTKREGGSPVVKYKASPLSISCSPPNSPGMLQVPVMPSNGRRGSNNERQRQQQPPSQKGGQHGPANAYPQPTYPQSKSREGIERDGATGSQRPYSSPRLTEQQHQSHPTPNSSYFDKPPAYSFSIESVPSFSRDGNSNPPGGRDEGRGYPPLPPRPGSSSSSTMGGGGGGNRMGGGPNGPSGGRDGSQGQGIPPMPSWDIQGQDSFPGGMTIASNGSGERQGSTGGSGSAEGGRGSGGSGRDNNSGPPPPPMLATSFSFGQDYPMLASSGSNLGYNNGGSSSQQQPQQQPQQQRSPLEQQQQHQQHNGGPPQPPPPPYHHNAPPPPQQQQLHQPPPQVTESRNQSFESYQGSGGMDQSRSGSESMPMDYRGHHQPSSHGGPPPPSHHDGGYNKPPLQQQQQPQHGRGGAQNPPLHSPQGPSNFPPHAPSWGSSSTMHSHPGGYHHGHVPPQSSSSSGQQRHHQQSHQGHYQGGPPQGPPSVQYSQSYGTHPQRGGPPPGGDPRSPPHPPHQQGGGPPPIQHQYSHGSMQSGHMMRNYSEDSGARISPPHHGGGMMYHRGAPPPHTEQHYHQPHQEYHPPPQHHSYATGPPPPDFMAPHNPHMTKRPPPTVYIVSSAPGSRGGMMNQRGGSYDPSLMSKSMGPGGSGVYNWTKDDDVRLNEIMKKYKNPRDWEPIAKEHGRGKTPKECHERWIRYLKPGVRKGQWQDHEDAIVVEAVTTSSEQPFTRWSDLAQRLPGRVGKQIRDRWVNHLNPNINHMPFSREDDLLLWEGHEKLGKRWVEISTKYFNSSRSENHIKNRWYSASFKKFIANEFGPDAYAGKKGGTDKKGSDDKKDSAKSKKDDGGEGKAKANAKIESDK